MHARWNPSLIQPLVEGAKKRLLERGVKEARIVIQSVPGSWELPVGVQRYLIAPPPDPPLFSTLPSAMSGNLSLFSDHIFNKATFSFP